MTTYRSSASTARPRIVQICREIADGGGVSGVAAQLEAGFLAAGYDCRRFTLKSVGLSPKRLHSSRVVDKLLLIRDVLWYSIVGTLVARIRYSGRDAVVICHNDVLYGDIYVNHGLHKLLVLESPNRLRMLLRNPLHWFLLGREEIRHRSRMHRRVVTLSKKDSDDIVRLYPSTSGKVVQLANGVHLKRFSDAGSRRSELRNAMGVKEGDVILLFVGHEFERKGLFPVIGALAELGEQVRLWVVGGNDSMISGAKAEADKLGVGHRTQFFGTHKEGVEDFFGAADLFVLPSEYEAVPLVLLEAMAAGAVPLMTPVGAAPELIQPGVNGYLVDRQAQTIAAAVSAATQSPDRLADMAKRAAETVPGYDWPQIVQRYIELVESVHASRRR
jgi:UDP-glucose:(heptosyl)LPS alpha-1,3-glucosyltransferase